LGRSAIFYARVFGKGDVAIRGKMLHEAIDLLERLKPTKSIYLWRKHDEINFQSHNFTSQPIKQAKLYINGQWCSASDETRPTSPINETAIVDIPEADDRDVEDAILRFVAL